MVFWCLLTQKAPIRCLFSTTFGELFLVYSLANTLVFWLLTPVSVGVGSEIGQICGVFSSKDSKMHIFLTFLNGYIHPNNFKNKNKLWGFAPNPTHFQRGRRGRWQTLSTYPYGECWVDSKASRVKCTTSSPLTPLHLRGGSKTNRSGRSWKPVKACEATA